MKSLSRITLLALLLIVLGFLSSTLINSSVSASAAALPFHAVFDGNANPYPIDACTLGNNETGSGHALHLGRFTWSSAETVQFLSCSPSAPPGPAIAVTGTFTLVAANGDEILGEYHTTGTLDPVNGVSVRGGYTLVSGTGRFSNVAGSGVIAASGGASPPFEFVSTMDGTINYSGQ
jgi:hypothetical protein